MKGCRALSNSEAILIEQTFTNIRDKCLFIFGISVGFRISELLSIRVKDVYDGTKVNDRVFLARKATKGKREGRSAILNQRTKDVISEVILSNSLGQEDYLFSSRKGAGPLGRRQGWTILKLAYARAGLEDKGLATHSLRKSFARAVYLASNKNLLLTQKSLGHASLNSTSQYISTLSEEVDEVVLGIDIFKAS